MTAGPAAAQAVRADPGDAAQLSSLIALAFHDLPPSTWLIPDSVARREVFPDYFRLYVDHAFEAGAVYTTPELAAVALWLPNGTGHDDPPAGYDARLAAVAGGWVDRFRAFDAQLDKHHPAGERHDHLAILAVHPTLQGRGVGSALLDAHHRELASGAEPVAAYLEAASLDSRRLYARHGYQDLPEPIPFPDGKPSTAMMYPMWRPPTPVGRTEPV
ncbi:MAG TPA: GNAT family N-acetyltransferase [Actinocrinis sp.]|uniref:GNAT family N-acetyltransferase n=1 Tax=Actinocrinis sp. TaxID=1920516 RepID=UPI002DDD0F09|nr:GNAT family N-acetyltransferase [Actinocrinis sp.]HEV2348144.1 GNAT family N-acetyltransferase [Actinocrinis sp.]